MWISLDSDIRFARSDIDRLLSHDLPLVFGMYPIKNADGVPCVGTFRHDDKFGYVRPGENGLVEVRRAGAGCMAVKREVLEKMKEDNGGPALRYHSDCGGEWNNDSELQYDFFSSGVVEGEVSAYEGTDADGYPIREWLPEDFLFAENARKLGFKVMVDPTITLGHIGSAEHRCANEKTLRDGSWRSDHDLIGQEREVTKGKEGEQNGRHNL